MRYSSFEIRNFRGIKHARLELSPAGAGIFTLIGLNESGKTTILEAISNFRLGTGDEKSLYQSEPSAEDPSTFVPKHEKYNFTGDITIEATVEFENGDKEACINWAESQSNWHIDKSSIPDSFRIKRGYKFLNSDRVATINDWSLTPEGTEGRGKKKKPITANDTAWAPFTAMVSVRLPEIVYFPTFIFEQPDKIVLNPQDGERSVDKLYRNILVNVGKSLEKPINLKTHIVDRIIQPDTPIETWQGWFGLSQNKKDQVDSAVEELSHELTSTVFDSWSKVFGKSFSGREIRLKHGVDSFDDGSPRIYVQIGLKDGKQTYDISERSLGFRWFFSFLLFTLFRTERDRRRPTLFLLDEPASNLHSSAQTQLMESFPRIAKGDNLLIYSTHSHYLVNPEWLDQAYIVSNLSVDYDDVSSITIRSVTHTDISLEKYRTFVGSNPDKTTYFQPVLDRLQVIPSKLDSLKPCVLLEGKGDYLILKSGLRLCDIPTDDYALVPTRGADHFGEIVGIMLGWGVNFSLCFDADTKGKKAQKEYLTNWSLPAERAFTLSEFDRSLDGLTIEGLLDTSDLNFISSHYGIPGRPSKSQIQLFFSEVLALKRDVPVSEKFKSRVRAFDSKTRTSLGLAALKPPKAAKAQMGK